MGRGNLRLITWEGEKTLTFTITDALLSPVSLGILAGAGIYKGVGTGTNDEKVNVHMAGFAEVSKDTSTSTTTYTIDLSKMLGSDEINESAPIFVVTAENGVIEGKRVTVKVDDTNKKLLNIQGTEVTDQVFVDFYITKFASKVSEIQISSDAFSGTFYVEAETLYRREHDSYDMPAILTLPKVKIQSNFSIAMSPTGDPSTFDFVLEAMPDYTYFDQTKKMMCVIQIVEDAAGTEDNIYSVMDASKKTNDGWKKRDSNDPNDEQGPNIRVDSTTTGIEEGTAFTDRFNKPISSTDNTGEYVAKLFNQTMNDFKNNYKLNIPDDEIKG